MGMLQYDFMVRALIAGLVIGIICPALGNFLVIRRYAFMADAISHVCLAGVAIGLWLGVASYSPFLVIVVAVLAAMTVDYLRTHSSLSPDALLALVMSGGLALAVIFFGLVKEGALDITSYLFGSLMTVNNSDLWLIIAVAIIVLLFLALLYKELYFICSDEQSACVAGLPVGRLNLVFIFLVALTVAVSLRVVGTLLVGALMVIPVLASLIIGRSFQQVFYYSIGLGVISALLGLVGSYQFGLATGGCIVLVALFFFALFYVVKWVLALFKQHSVLKDFE